MVSKSTFYQLHSFLEFASRNVDYRAYFDSYANPIFGASMTVSGGYGANVSSSLDSNGYYALSLKPTNIGGPFALSFAVTSPYGNYSTIQSNLTVTAPIVVPVASILQGVTIAGQTGTMPNQGALTIVPGKDNKAIPAGYHNGSGVVSGDSDLIASNIKSGKNIFGVTGNLTTGKRWASGTVPSGDYDIVVTGLNFAPSFVMAVRNPVGDSSYNDFSFAIKNTNLFNYYTDAVGKNLVFYGAEDNDDDIHTSYAATFTSNGFTIRVARNTSYQWIAFE